MSKYDYIKNLNDNDFRRLTGIKRETFNLMLSKLYEAQRNKKQTGKHFIKLSIEDKLLLELEYLRENRTFYSIAMGYGINETTAIRASHWVENILSKCSEFKLPSKRRIVESDMDYEVFVVDATETPIERPMIKNKEYTKDKKQTENEEQIKDRKQNKNKRQTEKLKKKK